MQHLHLKRAAERVKLGDRPPRQELVAAIEADQMLDLLRRRDAASRAVWEANDAAVFETDALLACALERRACHAAYVAGVGRLGN